MQPVISKCGNMCSSCPWGVWSRKNLSPEDWSLFEEDVKKYVGYSVVKNPCHGCQTPNENLSKDVGVHNFLRGCCTRACAFYNEFRNCAYCSRYPCDSIEVLNRERSREDVEKRLGIDIPEDMYEKYVRIYEGKKNLDEIRSTLKQNEISEPKIVEQKGPKIVPFPDINGAADFKRLHDSLSKIMKSSLGIVNADVISGQELIKDRRERMLRILWIVARYGVVKGSSLLVDSITINTHKKGTSGFPTSEKAWKRWLLSMSEIGIKCEMEFADIDEDSRASPIGWLRDRIPGTDDPVWFLRMELDESLGNAVMLKTLQTYASSIDEKYGTRAFGNFKKIDMRFLEK